MMWCVLQAAELLSISFLHHKAHWLYFHHCLLSVNAISHEDTCSIASWEAREEVTCNLLNLVKRVTQIHTHTHTSMSHFVSYHIMMWREVKGVLFAQQFTVLVVHVLLIFISPVEIIVFNLCNDTDKQRLINHYGFTSTEKDKTQGWDTVSVSFLAINQFQAPCPESLAKNKLALQFVSEHDVNMWI